MKKITLTSIVAITFALPAFAENFPGNGYMLENKTYDGAATYANMGVYSDSVNATADYSDNTYTVTAGTYLPAASETVTQCPANSFCPGLTGPTYYDANNAQGATSCPAGYPNSAAGASASTDCYTACTTANVAHSASVTGNDYDGGDDTCSAASCVNGYHVQQDTLSTTIGTVEGSSYAANEGDGTSLEGNVTTYGIAANEPNAFGVTYSQDKGQITGHGRCSTQSGTNNNWTWSDPTIVSNLTDETGQDGAQYCYCNITGYTPAGGTMQSLSAPWVFSIDIDTVLNCVSFCAFYCAHFLQSPDTSSLAFRAAVFGSVEPEPATCAANTITINWSDVDGVNGTHTTDVSYDGDITTPVKAAVKPGKTFVGWKFEKPGCTSNAQCQDGEVCSDGVCLTEK